MDIRVLIQKLDPSTTKSLEQAVSLCSSKSHYKVEVEHWLISLLQANPDAFNHLYIKFNIDKDGLLQDLQKFIADFKTGNDRTPALSTYLIEWIRNTWSLISLELNREKIDSLSLLLALCNDDYLFRQAQSISAEFKKIDIKQLREIVEKDLEANTTSDVNTSQKNNNSAAALKQFTINLTEQARLGKIDPVIGRDNEIRQIIDILLRRRQNNPILTGEAGVGKTAVVEGLALRIANQDVPDALRDVQLHILDLALLQAGAGIKGEFEQRLKSVIEAVKQSPHPIIIFIDEAHNLIGAGNQAGQGDAANLLKPALARGELRTIAATTWSEYKKFFEKDAALTRRFQVIKVEEPDEVTAVQMLRGLMQTLEQHHQVRILNEALIAAVQLSKRYIPQRQLPDKAISILDTACARVRLLQTTTPARITNYRRQLADIDQAEILLKREHEIGMQHTTEFSNFEKQRLQLQKDLKAAEQQWHEEQQALQAMQQLEQQLTQFPADSAEKQKCLKELNLHRKKFSAQSNTMLVPDINAHIITQIISDWTGIPAGQMMNDEVKKLLQLEEHLQTRVIGQDHAIKTICQSIYNARAQLSDPRKPHGVFLLLGSSGIGKTETALALAEFFYGGRQSLTVINMSEFKEEHKISMLTGSPAGYIGYGEGGLLTEAVRRRPYGIILLDEMEKAHPNVQDIFFQVFDKGMLFDGEGREIDFKNTMIIMTSNVGSNTLIQHQNKPLADINILLQNDLSQHFKAAFLSRVNWIPFLPLSEKLLERIAAMQLAHITHRLQQHYQANFDYTPAILQQIVANCQFQEGGARHIEHYIAQQILPLLSVEILKRVGAGKKIKSVNLSLSHEQQLEIKIG